MDAGFTLIVCVLIFSTTAVQSQNSILRGPANALKKVGDSVSLECVTINNNCHQIEWSKMEGAQSAKKVYTNDMGMINANVFPSQRYSVNSTRTGGCKLTITRLEISDSGKFICSFTVNDREERKCSVLVVIRLTESCRSNVTSGELAVKDGYRFWTTINVPPKSVEPSNVILSFQNMIANENETMVVSQSLIIKTTLTGIARKKNITRVCTASVSPATAVGLDGTTATLDVCTIHQLVDAYPVDTIGVSPHGPCYAGDRVRCTADGRPFPTFKWTNLKSGDVVSRDDVLVITGDAGDKYNCTATNVVKGRVTSQTMTIEVSCKPQTDGHSMGIGVSIGAVAMLILGSILFAILGTQYKWIKRHETDDKKKNGIENNIH